MTTLSAGYLLRSSTLLTVWLRNQDTGTEPVTSVDLTRQRQRCWSLIRDDQKSKWLSGVINVLQTPPSLQLSENSHCWQWSNLQWEISHQCVSPDHKLYISGQICSVQKYFYDHVIWPSVWPKLKSRKVELVTLWQLQLPLKNWAPPPLDTAPPRPRLSHPKHGFSLLLGDNTGDMIMTSWDLRPSESNYQMILLMILMMMIKRWSRMIQMRTQTTLLQCCPGCRVRPGLEWDTAPPVDTVWTQLCGSRSPEHTSSDQPRHLAVTQWSSPTILSRSRPTIQTIMNLFLV